MVEGQNIKHENFRMAEVSKLRIHERSNIERPNLLVLVTKIGKKIKKIDLYQTANIKIGKVATRTIPKLPILEAKFWFCKLKKF